MWSIQLLKYWSSVLGLIPKYYRSLLDKFSRLPSKPEDVARLFGIICEMIVYQFNCQYEAEQIEWPGGCLYNGEILNFRMRYPIRNETNHLIRVCLFKNSSVFYSTFRVRITYFPLQLLISCTKFHLCLIRRATKMKKSSA